MTKGLTVLIVDEVRWVPSEALRSCGDHWLSGFCSQVAEVKLASVATSPGKRCDGVGRNVVHYIPLIVFGGIENRGRLQAAGRPASNMSDAGAVLRDGAPDVLIIVYDAAVVILDSSVRRECSLRDTDAK